MNALTLQCSTHTHPLVRASYETLRSEADYFGSLRFNYCVLDEGHVIKNPKSKITQVTNQPIANKRSHSFIRAFLLKSCAHVRSIFTNFAILLSLFSLPLQAVKMVQARHRLLLSGTPIQNNVLELWSLFDYLMPGERACSLGLRSLHHMTSLLSISRHNNNYKRYHY